MMIQDEGERQLTLLALATLALERPGFDYALSSIASSLNGRQMYEEFKELNADKFREPLPRDVILEDMKAFYS